VWVDRVFLYLLATFFDATKSRFPHFFRYVFVSTFTSILVFVRNRVVFRKHSWQQYNSTNFTLSASEILGILFSQTTFNNTSLHHCMRVEKCLRSYLLSNRRTSHSNHGSLVVLSRKCRHAREFLRSSTRSDQ
jgi:hypothetical protein